MVTATLERLKQRQECDIESYRQLVRDVARGESPDPDEVDGALARAEKTIEQFTTSVELLQRRHRAAADLKKSAKIESRQPELNAAHSD